MDINIENDMNLIEDSVALSAKDLDIPQIVFFDLKDNSYEPISLLCALETAIHLENSERSYLLLCKNISDGDLLEITKAFSLHPIINFECGSTSSTSNNFMAFENYFLLSINDFN